MITKYKQVSIVLATFGSYICRPCSKKWLKIGQRRLHEMIGQFPPQLGTVHDLDRYCIYSSGEKDRTRVLRPPPAPHILGQGHVGFHRKAGSWTLLSDQASRQQQAVTIMFDWPTSTHILHCGAH